MASHRLKGPARGEDHGRWLLCGLASGSSDILSGCSALNSQHQTLKAEQRVQRSEHCHTVWLSWTHHAGSLCSQGLTFQLTHEHWPHTDFSAGAYLDITQQHHTDYTSQSAGSKRSLIMMTGLDIFLKTQRW